MWVWNYIQVESIQLMQWAKCGESSISWLPTVLWALGAAALAHRLLGAMFRRFLFRRVPLWELLLQNLLFIWMVMYSLHFWAILVRIIKLVVEYCYLQSDDVLTGDEISAKKLMQQWMVWMFALVPLAVYIHTRPRPEPPPLMIWITASPWQRREMGPYGYYLNRPPLMQPGAVDSLRNRCVMLRRAYSDSSVFIKPTTKKKQRYSKSV
ncbi:hypothetical protein ACJJTC_010584 [Scirpophaga incertulas]